MKERTVEIEFDFIIINERMGIISSFFFRQ